ncbi:hypothetical protein HYALB_00012759 [Hymenoscyphus albidus]|uniref:Helicase C-terminal domain-containing protein n=1 Tax=Hymenoscyphus albidus TaxID=595503 RepID=A0A9N9LUH9_9HELO|nr:hypothetical protein HYALB_00012759 [Hymenoscyphus albidus]
MENSQRARKRQKTAEVPGDELVQELRNVQDEAAVSQLQLKNTQSNIPTANETTPSSSHSLAFESSFTFEEPNIPSHATQHDYVLDLTKYIPVGSLRIRKQDFSPSSQNLWKSCRVWGALSHPRDVYNPRAGPFIPNFFQDELLSSAVSSYKNLHIAGWIRMECKTQENHGQVRVYILPDDVGRAAIERDSASLRRSMHNLLANLDISHLTWNGHWSDNLPVIHAWSSLSRNTAENEASLFHVFNTLPSPKPTPDEVTDAYAKEAMEQLLASDLLGLKTKLHRYQSRSAALMLQREVQPAIIIDPRLRHVVDQNGTAWYYDESAGICLQNPRTYETAPGGICAETMGLGKTLICLSLILATRHLPSRIPAEYSIGMIPVRKKTGSLKDMAACTAGRTSTPWKQYFLQQSSDGYDMCECIKALRAGAGHYFLPCPPPRRATRNPIETPPRKIWLTAATIVVVPANLVQQWVQEIKKHTERLKVLIMKNGKEELPPAEKLAEFDIILFTKPRFDRESKDGLDSQGRSIAVANRGCTCPYIGATRTRDCTCFRIDGVYRSPLKDLHFKRLITDEGHNFGNASKNQKTEAMVVLDGLQLDARWIVSGTPTQGLYGAEVGNSTSQAFSTPVYTPASTESDSGSNMVLEDSHAREVELLLYQQERKDLEKLGNIATTYLRARPWATSKEENENASWTQYVLQPRHGQKSRGSMECLRATLESMIIRHRPEDVEQDVVLPPLKIDTVYLEGSIQDKLSLNMFTTLIVSNAITSERTDADYFFNRGNKDALKSLFANMREASFFWSNKPPSESETTLKICQDYLENPDNNLTPEDRALLQQSIIAGQRLISNDIAKAANKYHEMPMFVENNLSDDIRMAMSLNRTAKTPTLMGATMINAAQNFVDSHMSKEDPCEGLVGECLATRSKMTAAKEQILNTSSKKRKKGSAALGRTITSSSASAAISVSSLLNHDDRPSPKKRALSKALSAGEPQKSNGSSVAEWSDDRDVDDAVDVTSRTAVSGTMTLPNVTFTSGESTVLEDTTTSQNTNPPKKRGVTMRIVSRDRKGRDETEKPIKSAMKKTAKKGYGGLLTPIDPLDSAKIVSTASAKLTYLMDQISLHYVAEKILVFYESENTAYYIAQALECIGVKHLIYAKSLSAHRRAQYVVTFNGSSLFRVLLMDVSQAAFGLDMSSASRVYFVNPVFSPQIEAQAVKRAHRIGQSKPVFVETLVLKGSIEEVMMRRRAEMSTEQHSKCKNLLDDDNMYEWVRSVNIERLFEIGEDVGETEQMEKLKRSQKVFGRGAGTSSAVHDPDEDLILHDGHEQGNKDEVEMDL